MSDELRDLLKRRAENVAVPSDDLGGVVRGGRALKWRKRLYSTGAVVLVAVLAWTTVPELLSSPRNDDRPPIATTSTPPTTEVVGPCDAVPFRATYLPEGWSYELQQSENPKALGRYTTIEEGRFEFYVDIARKENQHVLAADVNQMPNVLGSEARIGRIHEGFGVEFTYNSCEYSLNAFGMGRTQLRKIAEGLRPTDSCSPKRVTGPDANLEDGRYFVYIKGVDVFEHGMGIQFDRAEFLTGTKANEAAVAAGAIQKGESVPNDYFIVNQSKRTEALGFADDVEIYVETASMDGGVGPAPADIHWLACAFSGNEFSDKAHQRSPYWITVQDQSITEIEEQYLP